MLGFVRRIRASGSLAVAFCLVGGCGWGGEESAEPVTISSTVATEPEPAPVQVEPLPPGPANEAGLPKPERPELARSAGGPKLSVVASGLEVPWEIAFLPGGRALVTERAGRVRLLTADRKLKRRPIAEIAVEATGEAGLLGLAVDPSFKRNRFVYLYRTTAAGNQVARYRFENGRLSEQGVVLDGIVSSPIHDGGRIHFGPDRRLYVSTGDASQTELSQRRGSPNGKFLSLGPRQYRGGGGSPEVVSLGHRNPQGFDWHPQSGRLYATEHGPDGFDEVNLIEPGSNYGWPDAVGPDHAGYASPLTTYQQSIAPSGATFLSLPGSTWSGDFVLGALVGQQMRRLRFDGRRVRLDKPLFEGRLGRVRTVVEGPDGALYALTSNRDGRGSPAAEDDRIFRIVPPRG